MTVLHPSSGFSLGTLAWFCLASSLLGALSACGDDSGMAEDGTGSATATGSEGADSTGAPAIDEAEVLERAEQYATALVQINDQPFASQHGIAAAVNVFVDPAAADLFRTLDPAAPAELAFVEGTLIVKEHLDADGNPDGYNLMVRGPEGYDPEASDWYWARVTADGTAAESGAIGYCIACHATAPGHVFGVEADNQR